MLAFSIASRFLSSNKGQTILISLGIAVGVSVQIFIGSLISGLQISLIDKTVGSSPHITISNVEKGVTISAWEKLESDIKKTSGIKYVSSHLNYSAFITKDSKDYSILLRGFNLDNANDIYKLKNSLVEGRLPEGIDQIIVGSNLRDDAGFELYEDVDILTPSGKTFKVKIVGFYDLKVSAINSLWAISNLKTVQKIASTGNVVSGVEIQVADVFKADEVASKLDLSAAKDLEALNWKDENESLLSGLNGQSISSLMIQVFVLISVILGIASVLIISVVQKSKQIGILKAMGIQDKTSSMIFLAQGLILGIIGATLGLVFGLGLSYAFTKFALNPDGTPVIALYIDKWFIITSWFIAVVASVLASFIPSRKSLKLSPMEVIKNG